MQRSSRSLHAMKWVIRFPALLAERDYSAPLPPAPISLLCPLNRTYYEKRCASVTLDSIVLNASCSAKDILMANDKKAKIKVLYLLKILQEETNAEHGLTMSQMIERFGCLRHSRRAQEHLFRSGHPARIRYRHQDLPTRSRLRSAMERRDFAPSESSCSWSMPSSPAAR